jgi:hypothetical protein
MIFVIILAFWLLVPVTALLSMYLDVLLSSERKAKANNQMAYLKVYRQMYKECEQKVCSHH